VASAGLATACLLCGGLVAVAYLAVKERIAGGASIRSATVTAEPLPDQRSAQSAAAFAGYDALASVDAADRDELHGIDSLLRAIEQAALDPDDTEKLREQFDSDRHVQRLIGHGLSRIGFADRLVLRRVDWFEADEGWARLRRVAVVRPTDDPQSRIVYVLSWSDEEDENEFRFWIARNGNRWKLYDWERLDLAMPESLRMAICCKYASSPLLTGYERWAEHIQAFHEAVADANDADHVRARSALQRAEGERVPPELRDYVYLVTAYHWQSLGDYKEALRCHDRIADPAGAPGTWFGRMSCLDADDPEQAAEYGRTYQDRVATTPGLCRILAGLYTRLERPQDARDQWRQVLRFEPEDPWAWGQWMGGAPADELPAMLTRLERLPAPAATIVQIGLQAGGEHPELLTLLVDTLRGKQPSAPATLRLAAWRHETRNELEEAAELYQTILAGPTDVETRNACFESLANISTSLGREVEAYEAAPDTDAAFDHFAYLHDEGELADAAMRRIVAMHRERRPQHAAAWLWEAHFAIDDQRFAEAENTLRQFLEANEDEDWQTQARSHLARCLYKAGRWQEAYDTLPPASERFDQLAWEAQADQRWDIVRGLLDRYRLAAPDDPDLAGVEGILAEHEFRWTDALRHFRRAAELHHRARDGADDSYFPYAYRQRVAVFRAGDWLAEYQQAGDPHNVFVELADELLRRQDWVSFDALAEAHRQRHPGDPRLKLKESEAAWWRADYAACAELSAAVIAARPDEDVVSAWQWREVRGRWLASLQRLGRLAEAQAVLEQAERDKAPPLDARAGLAVVAAGTGRTDEAISLSLRAAEELADAHVFYASETFGRLFLDPTFAPLHDLFPLQPSPSVQLDAVLHLASPMDLSEEFLRQAWHDAGGDETVAPVALLTDHPRGTAAFAFPVGHRAAWVAWGRGRFDDSVPAGPDVPLAGVLLNAGGWVAAGRLSWTYQGASGEAALQRRLACLLAGDRAALAANNGYGPHIAADAAIMAAWQVNGDPHAALTTTIPAGDGDGSARLAKLLMVEYPSDSGQESLDEHRAAMVAAREFERALNAAAIGQRDQGQPLRVRFDIGQSPIVEPLWISVGKSTISYGVWTFDGLLESGSRALRLLRGGLPVRIDNDQVRAFRAGDGPEVARPNRIGQ
jgi:tetratricopeptide (TPR) repeat protein